MIRVLRVARRGALKARVAAAEQIHGVLYSAPEELRAAARAQDQAAGRAVRGMRPGTAHQRRQRPPRSPCVPWLAAGSNSRPNSTELDTQLRRGRRGRAHPGGPARGRGRHRRPAPRHRRRQPPTAPLRGRLRPPVRRRTDPRVLGPHRPPPAQPRRRPPRQRRPVAHRPGPHALPPAHRAYVERRTKQGLSKLDIMRCLKRYIAREVYHHLTEPPAPTPAACPK